MRSGSLSTSTRRAFFGVLVVALLCGASMRAQQAAGQQPAAAPAQQAPDAFMFTTDAGQVIFQVKSDKTADFEAAWSEIKAKTSASEKADWKALGESITLWKMTAAAAPDPTQPVVYVLQINPASKGISYDPGKILYAPGSLWERKDADPLYKKIAESLAAAGFNVLPLTKVSK